MSEYNINGTVFHIEPYEGYWKWRCQQGKWEDYGNGDTQLEALQNAMRYMQIRIDADRSEEEKQDHLDEERHNKYLLSPYLTDRV